MNLIQDIATGMIVAASAVVAESGVGPVAEYAGLIERFGIMACLLLYFLVRDYFRNKADLAEKQSLVNKLDNLEVFIRAKLMDKLDDTTVALDDNAKTHKRLLHALEMKTPCLREAVKDLRDKETR